MKQKQTKTKNKNSKNYKVKRQQRRKENKGAQIVNFKFQQSVAKKKIKKKLRGKKPLKDIHYRTCNKGSVIEATTTNASQIKTNKQPTDQ